MDSRMDQHQEDDLEALLEQLRSLRITKKDTSNKTTKTETTNKISTAPAVQNEQAVILKSMVLDLGQFNKDRTKFEDQQREIRLFLKSNRITGTDDRITIILAQLREGIAGIYAQKKLDQLKKEIDIQN